MRKMANDLDLADFRQRRRFRAQVIGREQAFQRAQWDIEFRQRRRAAARRTLLKNQLLCTHSALPTMSSNAATNESISSRVCASVTANSIAFSNFGYSRERSYPPMMARSRSSALSCSAGNGALTANSSKNGRLNSIVKPGMALIRSLA